jgi:hypothetical protein
MIDAIDVIDLFEKGLPPVAGGVLDQSAAFINAAKFFHNEKQLAKAESNE